MIEKADFEEWKDLYATRKWFDMVRDKCDAMKEVLAAGGTVNSTSIEATAIQTIDMVAQIRQLYEVLNFKIEGNNDGQA